MNTPPASVRLSRREVIKWLVAASAAGVASEVPAFAQSARLPRSAQRYGTDPHVNQSYSPGDFWPLTMTAQQRETTAVLADFILPADDFGPAASTLRVPDFIDEWISAPYPQQESDCPVIVKGLAWIEAEARRRFAKGSAALDAKQAQALCDDIAWLPDAQPEFRKPAEFFDRFRNIAAGAYFGTREGWQAIGYVGNTPLAVFPGPPPEVLEKLGLEQTIA